MGTSISKRIACREAMEGRNSAWSANSKGQKESRAVRLEGDGTGLVSAPDKLLLETNMGFRYFN